MTVREDDVQRAIVEALRILGYEVLITSRRRRRCAHCGRYSAGGDGVTRGTPDLFVFDQRIGAWRGMEVKGPNTRVSEEQEELLRRGMVAIVRSIEDALAVLGRKDIIVA